MPNIKPISDLRNYASVLKEVAVGSPVYLTKNGRGRYAIVDLVEYEKQRAADELRKAIDAGRRSGEQEGWMTLEELEASLGVKRV